jgi:DNA replication and repair protein RecF
MASQGQHRTIVLAMQLAEMAVVARARDLRPVLLLDDVSSELDAERTRALLGAVMGQRGQVVVTTTRPELIDVPISTGSSGLELRRDFRVVGGRIWKG